MVEDFSTQFSSLYQSTSVVSRIIKYSVYIKIIFTMHKCNKNAYKIKCLNV